jgi:hypothetical protein
MRRPEHPIRAVTNALEILLAYADVRRRLRRDPIDGVVDALRRRPGPELAARTPALSEAQRLAVAVESVVSRLPFESRCLVRSLVLTRMLARRGYRTEFVLSAYTGEEFGAHAWVEWHSVPLLEPGTQQVELFRL